MRPACCPSEAARRSQRLLLYITIQHPFFWPQTSSSSSVYAVSLGSNSRTYSITDRIGPILLLIFGMSIPHASRPVTVHERLHRFDRHVAQGAYLTEQQMGKFSVHRRVWRAA